MQEPRKCECGCGEFPGTTFKYKRGHKPKVDTHPRTQLAKVEHLIEITSEIEAPEPSEEFIEISINAVGLDRLFSKLSLYEKSVAVAAALSAEE